MRLLLGLLSLCAIPLLVSGVGWVAHTEIIKRALEYYDNPALGEGVINQVLRNNNGALQAGCIWPDAYGDPLCSSGDFGFLVNATHTATFFDAAWTYFRATYPEPWVGNAAAEQLYSFLLGMSSHQVSDYGWISAGVHVPQGLERAVAEVNFDGNLTATHLTVNFGADTIAVYFWNTTYPEKWDVPSADLVNIANAFYGEDIGLTATEIDHCTEIQRAYREYEYDNAAQLYPQYARASIMFNDEMEDYFCGGMSDMAFWTRVNWDTQTLMALNGPENCDISHNPMVIDCNQRANSIPARKTEEEDKLTAQSSGTLRYSTAPEASPRQGDDYQAVFHAYSTNAKLGHALELVDFDGDSITDLLIGAPEMSEMGSTQVGCVYGIRGGQIKALETDSFIDLGLQSSAGFKICDKSERFSEFGTSVAVTEDFRLLVGAPHVGMEDLSYTGAVFVYQGVYNQVSGLYEYPEDPTQIMKPTAGYSLLGTGLSAIPGTNDAIIASKYHTAEPDAQKGKIELLSNGNSIEGQSAYNWFGQSVQYIGNDIVAVGAPLATMDGVSSSGSVALYNINTGAEVAFLKGTHEYGQFGYAIAYGDVTVDGNSAFPALAISATGENLDQSGSVYIYNADDLIAGTTTQEAVLLQGFSFNARFGNALDIRSQELLIGSRLHSEQNSEDGAVFIYSSLSTTGPNAPSRSIFAPTDMGQRFNFGWSVKGQGFDSYAAVISAPRNEGIGGSVYLY